MYNIKSADQCDHIKYGSVAAGYNDERSSNGMSYQIKILRTVCMMSLYLGLGLWSGMISPTAVDMVELYNCTYEGFVRATTMKAIGAMCGSFMGATMFDSYIQFSDLLICTMYFCGGVACISIPWSPNLIVMGFLFSVTGISHGTLNVVCSSLILSMWQESASTPLQGLHITYTIGAMLAPILCLPFLSQEHHTSCNVKPNSSYLIKTTQFPKEYLLQEDVKSEILSEDASHNTHVWMAYLLCGCWSIAVSLSFIVCFINKTSYRKTKYKESARLKDIVNPGVCAGGNSLFGLVFVILTLIVYILVQGRERGLSAYLFVIGNKSILKMTKSESAGLVTTYILCTAVGRGVSGVVSKYIKIHLLLFGQVTIASYIQMLMTFYALENNTSFWILTCLAAFFMGPTMPVFMGWCEKYIDITGTVTAIIDIGLALGSFMALWANGHLYELYGTVAVLWVGFILGVSLVAVLILLQVISCFRGEKHAVVLHLPINNYNCEESDNESAPLVTN